MRGPTCTRHAYWRRNFGDGSMCGVNAILMAWDAKFIRKRAEEKENVHVPRED